MALTTGHSRMLKDALHIFCVPKILLTIIELQQVNFLLVFTINLQSEYNNSFCLLIQKYEESKRLVELSVCSLVIWMLSLYRSVFHLKPWPLQGLVETRRETYASGSLRKSVWSPYYSYHLVSKPVVRGWWNVTEFYTEVQRIYRLCRTLPQPSKISPITSYCKKSSLEIIWPLFQSSYFRMIVNRVRQLKAVIMDPSSYFVCHTVNSYIITKHWRLWQLWVNHSLSIWITIMSRYLHTGKANPCPKHVFIVLGTKSYQYH
jgi:hypothetical protein